MRQSPPATLTGGAVGDALGMPFETMHFSSPRLAQWDGSFGSSSHHGLGPGQWTDDTQMSVALAESLLAGRAYDQTRAARSYLNLYSSGRMRGIGSTIRTAMDNLARGVPPVDSGVKGSEGNGTAMRAAPIGLALHKDLTKVSEAAKLDSIITHDSHEAIQGSIAVAVATAMLAQGCSKKELLGRLLCWIDDSEVRRRIQAIPDRLLSTPALAALIEMGTGGHVVETVPAALAAFVGTSSFEEAVVTAVMAGGDTDTTAAITGAMAGTLYGYEQVEPYLGRGLEKSLMLWMLDTHLWRG